MSTITGRKGFWKGKRLSQQHRLKLRLAKLGHHLSPSTEFKKGMTPWNKGTAVYYRNGKYLYPITCLKCKKVKMVLNHRQQCCSIVCAMSLRSVRYKGRWSGDKHPRWKGGRPSHGKQGYRLYYNPQHPHAHNGRYIFEHRHLIEQHLGRLLLPSEDVHHINGNKQDNRIENLIVMTKQEHTRHHQHLKRHLRS